MRSWQVVGIVVLSVVASSQARAAARGEIKKDDKHRYRLVVSVPPQPAAAGSTIETSFCLSQAEKKKVKACVGRMQGYLLKADRLTKQIFTRSVDRQALCTCDKPVELLRDQPVCWPVTVRIGDLGGSKLDISGFITLLEGSPDIGASVDSCVDVRSEAVSVMVTGRGAP